MSSHIESTLDGIAVIGMSGRFPGARNLAEFWLHLRSGRECIERFSDEELRASGVSPSLLSHPQYVKAGTRLPDADCFDASFFGYLPREAALMDPQQRLFLQHAWEALEHAGYPPQGMQCPVGVFAGASLNTYLLRQLALHPEVRDTLSEFGTMLANDKDFLSVRTSYKLNLKGPSLTVQTACSTSLVAVVQAVQSLLNYQCDVALAGGTAVHAPLVEGYLYKEGMILSPDGHCRSFDAQARGTVPGCGVGVVVLKRLQEAMDDGDTVYAVIRGAAMNNDGSAKVGFTAPSVEGQAECIASAQAMAGISPDTIDYVEAHGTATPLGDPIEVEALTRAFRAQTQRRQYCALGSAKSVMGHADAAAGIAGFIKLVLSIHHGEIPPSLHFAQPNPKIDFAGSPFFVNTELRPWPKNPHPRRGAVSSFGIGGTNAHCLLEEAPVRPVRAPSPGPSWHLFPLAAATAPALDRQIHQLSTALNIPATPDPEDVAFTLQRGRSHRSHRAALVVQGIADAVSALQSTEGRRMVRGHVTRENPAVAFLFPGQGNQYAEMGGELFRTHPVFREAVERCVAILNPILGLDLRTALYPSAFSGGQVSIHETRMAQPALFTVEYALSQVWMDLEVKPALLVGHSIGEYVAAVLAGVFKLEDALRLLALRARLMQSLPGGSMLAAKISATEAESLMAGRPLALAASNSPVLSVISGPTPEVESFQQLLTSRKCACRILPTSHAFHSPMMEPIMAAYTAEVEKVTRHAPRIPMWSTLTAAPFTETEARDATYWARQLRFSVRFSEVAAKLVEESDRVLLEVGPGQSLLSHLRQQPARGASQVLVGSLPVQPESGRDTEAWLSGCARLWCAGVELDWARLHAGRSPRRIPLPTYPWEQERHWMDLPATASGPATVPGGAPAVAVDIAAATATAVGPASSSLVPPSSDETDLVQFTERVIQEQMEMMQRQLELLRQSASSDS